MADYECKACAKSYKSFKIFKTHLKSTTHLKNMGIGINVETYICNICKCVYKYKRSLDRHLVKCRNTLLPASITETETSVVLKYNADGTIPTSTIDEIPAAVKDAIINEWKATNPVPTPVHTVSNTQSVNAFGNENYACVTFGGNYEILRRPVDAFEYMIDDLYDDPCNINIIIMDKRNYLLKCIMPDRTIEILSLSTLIKKALAQNKQKFLEYCIQHMDVVNPRSPSQDIRNYSVNEHGLYNSVTGTTELIHNTTIRNIMPDFMSNTCLNHYNSEFKEILKIKFLEISHSSIAKLNFKNL